MSVARSLVSIVAALAIALGITTSVSGASRSFTAHLFDDEEVTTVTIASLATGQATFWLSDDGQSLSYRLIAANIENPVAAHIHLAPKGVNGNVVVPLFAGPAASGRHDGVLATGTITAANLVNDLAGHPLSDLIAAMEAGNAYVNVHTNDGVAPTNTGAGDMASGEIRGQIR